MIAAGLSRLLNCDDFKKWPPNVFEFRDLCKPTAADHGLPDEENAYWQAINWSRVKSEDKHPAVLFAMQLFDVFGWRRADAMRSRKIFAEAWATTVEHVAGGGELPEIPQEITEGSVAVTEKGQLSGRAAMLAAVAR